MPKKTATPVHIRPTYMELPKNYAQKMVDLALTISLSRTSQAVRAVARVQALCSLGACHACSP